MKLLLLPLPLLLFLTACGTTTDPQALMVPQATQAVIAVGTPAPSPTATIGYMETAQAAEVASRDSLATASAANLIVAGMTAEADRMNQQKLVIEQERLAWTAQADIWTAAAATYAVPGTQTASAIDRQLAHEANVVAIADLTAVAEQPTVIVALANAEAQAANADRSAQADVFVRFALGVFVVALTVYIFLRIIAMLYNRGSAIVDAQPEPEDDREPIPFKRSPVPQTDIWNRAEVPVTREQLALFADGVINRNMGAAFNAWEGTIVHKSLKVLRDWLEDPAQHFAYCVKRSNGTLAFTAEGEEFLLACLNPETCPPLPYKCIEKGPDLVHAHEIHAHEAEGEGVKREKMAGGS